MAVRWSWDFDKDAASRSYAPGSAHIYTVEQSVSNANILYAQEQQSSEFWRTNNKGVRLVFNY